MIIQCLGLLEYAVGSQKELARRMGKNLKK
jgi:hypothetical protein